MSRHFGAVVGVATGAAFSTRKAVAAAGIHRPLVAGISGSERQGADSVVLNGGREDDVDLGDVILYTGQGGTDPNTDRQVADQTLTRGNRALAVSRDRHLPVRVVRGSQDGGPFAPAEGYRYDGLYTVDAAWKQTGRSGFVVWRFLLVRDPSEPALRAPGAASEPLPFALAPTVETSVQRTVRTSALAARLLRLHDHTCQVCSVRLVTNTGGYAEAAYLQPPGPPAHGPHALSNLLCLCPNCHVQYDRGGLHIQEDGTVVDAAGAARGTLRRVRGHRLGAPHLAYRAARSRLAEKPD